MPVFDRKWTVVALLAAVAALSASACGDEFSGGEGTGGGAGAGNHAGGKSGASGSQPGPGGVANAGGDAPEPAAGTPGQAEGGALGAGGAGETGPTYADAILAAGPLVYWRMGKLTDEVLADETGGGNDLLLQGSGHLLDVTGAIVGDPDTAIGFDGVASFAIASDSRALDFADGAAFSLECWAKHSAGGESYFQHLFSNVSGVAGNRDGYTLYLLPEPAENDSARATFEYDRPAAEVGVYAAVAPAGTWGHYVAVYDGKQAMLYVNGTLADSGMVEGNIAARTVPFSVARAAGVNGSYFRGTLDELAIYPRALSTAEVIKHYGFGK